MPALDCTCYISGPSSGYPDCNAQAFKATADYLNHLGFEVINPLESDEERHDPEGKVTDEQWLKYIVRDLRMMAKADAIYQLPGWDQSFGASIEFLVAKRLKLLIIRHENWEYAHEAEDDD